MTRKVDVLIVGAGPVGLLLGNLLGQAGIDTLVIDRRSSGPRASMAIGITPPSLAILARLGLDESFVAAGVAVNHAVVHGDQRVLGELSFDSLPGPWPFILSLPQARTVELLENRLQKQASVELWRGWQLENFERNTDGMRAEISDSARNHRDMACRYLVDCSGAAGSIRRRLGLADERVTYPQNFVMADFPACEALGTSAHLWFTASGSVESFPLPDGRRWIVQTDHFHDLVEPELPAEIVARRTGLRLAGEPVFLSAFKVHRLLAKSYVADHILLAGDAAHLMSPVGGQGMNVGFADAAMLCDTLVAILRGEAPPEQLQHYSRARRQAAAIAIKRAQRGMWMGTRRGRLNCLWREPLLKLLLSEPVRRYLPPYFAMLTLPGPTGQKARTDQAPC
ncbi:MAG: FAD-dependent monooxygenase [Deltaproteobacteria bacterium]|nr:MAG: FAD-dependent monooxygenase [Deltaproteobacteria bacterium]